MSSNLYWRPVSPVGKSLPIELKSAMKKKYHHIDITLNAADVPYLQSLADAGVDGVQELLDA